MHAYPFDPSHLPPGPDSRSDSQVRRDHLRLETRRHFLGRMSRGLGGAALATLCGDSLLGALAQARDRGLLPADAVQLPNLAPKAKRAIYLFMGGAPSQLDLFDYKPNLADQFNQPLPASILGQQLNATSQRLLKLPIAPTIYKFKQHGRSRTWVSELLPWTARIVDDIALIKTATTDVINHDSAVTFILTGNAVAGKPSIGAWISYGLGRMSDNLPTFVVLVSRVAPEVKSGVQAVFPRFWGSGYLPASHAGVALRSVGDPVLYLQDPKGLPREARRAMLDGVQQLNQDAFADVGDPATHARIDEYEMAFRMQTAVPELTDLSREPAETFELYGPEARTPGTFANHCLMARRMAERGVRFTQIFSRGWDSHQHLPTELPHLCRDIDRPCYALVTDLKRRGMLDDTLIIWGGEFGRTVFCEGALTRTNYGRDHHGKCFSMWMAGGGIRPGITYGETDEYGFNILRDPAHVRNINATILHQFGIDHNRLTFKFEGLEQKLTGTTPARVIEGLLA